MTSAVILAGGSVKPDLEAQFGIPSKGMIPLLGRIAVDFVVDAALACPQIDKVALVGPDAYREQPVVNRIDAFVVDQGGIPANLLAGMAALGEEDGQGVMLAGDSPLLTAESIQGFLDQVPQDSALCYPAVTKEGVLAGFPDREWTYIRLREGQVVCTNVLFFRASLLRACKDLGDNVEIARRKPWKLAALFGIGLLANYLLGRLSIEAAERRLSKLLSAQCDGVLSDDPLLAMDLDDSRDVPFVEEFLKARASGG